MRAAGSNSPPRLLFVNRSYWPDVEATGQLLTELCEDLAADCDVTVIAGQPNYNPGNRQFRRAGTEVHAGVTVQRVPHTRFPKRMHLGRIVNFITYLTMSLLAAVRMKRPDVIITETDPFLLPLLGAWLARWHRARFVVYLQDIYPDVAIALGQLRESWLTRYVRRCLFRAYRRADRIVVLSEEMQTRLITGGISPEKIEIVPNWADTRQLVPQPRQNPFRRANCPEAEFVVMHSGNLGLSQNLECIVAAAAQLRDDTGLQFLFVGDGANKGPLAARAAALGAENLQFLPYQEKEHLSQSLSAADLQLVSINPRVAACLMPSKLYGILAAGVPVLAIAPLDSELSRLVRETRVGWTVPPDDPAAVCEAIRRARNHPAELRECGERGRALAVSQFDRQLATRNLRNIFVGSPLENHAAPLPAPQSQITLVERIVSREQFVDDAAFRH